MSQVRTTPTNSNQLGGVSVPGTRPLRTRSLLTLLGDPEWAQGCPPAPPLAQLQQVGTGRVTKADSGPGAYL